MRLQYIVKRNTASAWEEAACRIIILLNTVVYYASSNDCKPKFQPSNIFVDETLKKKMCNII